MRHGWLRWRMVAALMAAGLTLVAACGDDAGDSAADDAESSTSGDSADGEQNTDDDAVDDTGADDDGTDAESADDDGAGDDSADDNGTDTVEVDTDEDDAAGEDEAPTGDPEPDDSSTGFDRDPALAPPLPDDVVAATGGNGTAQPLSTAPLPDGWTEEEFLFGGDATSYEAIGELTDDSRWEVATADTAAYRTRMIVRRPPAENYSGTVLVEWFNVTSGADTSPDWGFTAEEIARSGHAYVGVSVQAVGVVGAAGETAVSDLVPTGGLAAGDTERYGTLRHPGDAFAFDIMSQAGVLVKSAADGGTDVLGGLEPTTVIGMGESQSAIFMATYVNAIHPVVGVYDGFLLHSRGAGAPNPDGSRDSGPEAVTIRTDIDVPVFQYEAETDINRLGFFAARQDDGPNIHTWEVAGTAHADAYTLSVAAGAERDPALGEILGCVTGINDGPHHETLQAGLRHLVDWVVDGTTPPTSPLIEAESDGDAITIVRDDLGLALGGIRTPGVDAPRRVISGDAAEGGGGFCGLFGQTLPIDAETLAERYESDEAYLEEMQASADNAVEQGWLLPEDAATLVADETARLEAESTN